MGIFRVRSGVTSSRTRMFGEIYVLSSLAKERKISRYGNLTAKTKNRKKKKCVSSYTEDEGISIIIQSVIYGGGQPEIYRINRDKKSTLLSMTGLNIKKISIFLVQDLNHLLILQRKQMSSFIRQLRRHEILQAMIVLIS